jgi:hypothetical protein
LEAAFAIVAHTAPLTSAVISNSPASGTIGVAFTFDGSSSNANSFVWTFVSVPVGSAFTVGPTYSILDTFEFTPDINGTYDVQLQVSGYDYGEISSPSIVGQLTVGAAASASSTNRIVTGATIDRNNIASGQLTLGVVRRKLRKKRN